MPKRIQRKRTKGWKMPEGAIYVGRPTVWGNPFVTDGTPSGSPGAVVEKYREAICGLDHRSELVDWFRAHGWKGAVPIGREVLSWLRGKDLACWCPLDQPCHADVLLEIANS